MSRHVGTGRRGRAAPPARRRPPPGRHPRPQDDGDELLESAQLADLLSRVEALEAFGNKLWDADKLQGSELSTEIEELAIAVAYLTDVTIAEGKNHCHEHQSLEALTPHCDCTQATGNVFADRGP